MMPFNTQGLIDLLRVVAVLKQIGLDTIQIIMQGPNLKEENEFRQWVRAVVKAGKTIALVTPNVYDDAVLNVLAALVDSDDSWNAFYGMIHALLRGEPLPKDSPAALVAYQIVEAVKDQ